MVNFILGFISAIAAVAMATAVFLRGENTSTPTPLTKEEWKAGLTEDDVIGRRIFKLTKGR